MEIRGAVAGAYDGMSFAWDPQSFPGFYYDIDDDLPNRFYIYRTVDLEAIEPAI